VNQSNLRDDIASLILKNVSAGLAIFSCDSFEMKWCNASFKKQTWFGGAFGGKFATKVLLVDLFDKKDHSAVQELFNIAVSVGQSYDFQRMVRRGPVGSFPAELKLHKIQGQSEELYVCIEITDLSINKLYDELESAHGAMRERLADLMAAQAELHYSVRMNTISEMGADLAHQLINPIIMCRDILQSQVLPLMNSPQAVEEINKSLRYMKDIQDLAVWFRKFSNPRNSETQICNVTGLVEDSLILNLQRLSKQGVNTKIRKKDHFNPFVLAIPVNLIMWINAAITELAGVLPGAAGIIYIDINEDVDAVSLDVHSECDESAHLKVQTGTLEGFAKRLPGSAQFVPRIESKHLSFTLKMACFFDGEQHEEASSLQSIVVTDQKNADASGNKSDGARPAHLGGSSVRPLVLVVDDEKDIRRLLKRTFKNMSIESVEACDGVEAVQIFKDPSQNALANRIKVIVSDVRMPRMTGPHLLIALREADVQMPFIFFSSNLVDQGQNSDFRYKNVYYLTKESGLEDLKRIVNTLMEEAAAALKAS
jgi:CheY-like chemotaxis protein